MAEKKFLVDLNLSGNKAKNFRLEDYADNTAPTSNFVGRMIYTTNSSNPDRVEVYNGSAWKTFAFTDDVPAVSITLTAPDLFTVTGSPAAYNGTLDFEWNTVAVNRVLASPATGSTAAIPTFRALVAADIPTLEASKISDFNEAVSDAVGGMVTSNTENGISVTYDDADNTLDFDVADFSITLTGDVTGSGTVTNLANVSFEATVADNSHAHTTGNITGIQEYVEDTASTMITAATHDGISVAYTDNSTGAGTLAFTNTDKGSAQNIFKTIAVTGQTSVAADTNTDTLTLAGSTGLTITTNDTTDTITFTNSGVTGITGTANEVEVSASTGSITIGLPNDVTIGGGLTVTGDLTVNGTTTTLNTDTLAVEDNIVILNSNITGTPSTNAGIEVERGTSTNASLIWNETSDVWQAGIAGSETSISLVGHAHIPSDITGIQEYVEDTIGAILSDSGTIDFTYTDNSTSQGSITAAVILAASNPYLNTTSGLAVDIATLETKLTTDGYTKKYSTTIGDGTAQTFTVTHSLSTRAVTVSVFESVSPWAEVEAEVLHTSTSAITVNTNSVPTAGQYTVVVVG
jgi:hypothetical protein